MGNHSSVEREYLLHEEKANLMEIFQSTDGKHSWRNKIHWGSQHPLTDWHHLKLSPKNTGHVIRIDLTDNNLVGTLPRLNNIIQLQELLINQNSLKGE